MEALAKQTTICDFCKQAITDNGMQADLTEPVLKKGDPKPKKQIFHFCDEECLRQFLNKKATKNAKAAYDGRFIQVDLHGE